MKMIAMGLLQIISGRGYGYEFVGGNHNKCIV